MRDGYAIIRDAIPEDAPTLAAVFAASWQGAYIGIIPDVDIRKMLEARKERYWRNFLEHSDGLLVIEADGDIAGYVTLGPARTRGDFQGEIYELYIAPEYQGIGLGERLFAAARHRLEESGKRGLIVWALTDNTGARLFYKGRGGEEKTSIKQKFTGKQLTKTAYAFD